MESAVKVILTVLFLFFHCIFKSVATKQAVFIIMSFPVKDARAFTGERFLRREHFDARALKLANV